MSEVLKEDVEAALKDTGAHVEERYEEMGFLYFPRSGDDCGRVFWKVEDEVRETTQPITFEDIHMNESEGWYAPSSRTAASLQELLMKYVNYKRQLRAVQKEAK